MNRAKDISHFSKSPKCLSQAIQMNQTLINNPTNISLVTWHKYSQVYSLQLLISSHNDVIKLKIWTFSELLALCAGNSPITGEFPAQRPVTRSFDAFVDLRLNKRLNKHSWAGDSRRHRTHYDVIVMKYIILPSVLSIRCVWILIWALNVLWRSALIWYTCNHFWQPARLMCLAWQVFWLNIYIYNMYIR